MDILEIKFFYESAGRRYGSGRRICLFYVVANNKKGSHNWALLNSA